MPRTKSTKGPAPKTLQQRRKEAVKLGLDVMAACAESLHTEQNPLKLWVLVRLYRSFHGRSTLP